ncbi:MAG TPA: hypothetical protein VKG23_07860 [Thermoanaerobaculia bacterium]|nr:hypothetical protein [Thermoanaerobaculia bacterium]
MSPDRREGLLLAAVVFVAAAILAVQLFVPPVVGLADNGDYERVIGYAGFQHTTVDPAERYFSFLRTKYAVVQPGWFRGGYLSSETLLAFAARGVHVLFSGGSVFDLRVLGAIHAALLLLALVLLVRATRDLSLATQLAVAVLLVFVFTDVGYVAPLNSFYSQAASLLFLLLTAAAAAEAIRRAKLSGALLLAYFGCALLFVGSKPQEKLAGPLLALFGLRLAGVTPRGAWKQVSVWLAIGLCAFSVWYGRHTPYTLREATMYQLVFSDLLVYSDTPAADAAELGLDPDWVRYRRTSPYRPDSPLLQPEFRRRFLHDVGYRRILRFYLAHPRRLFDRLGRASRDTWSLRPTFGNFEKSPAHPESTLATRFSLWSRLRGALGAKPVLFLVLLLGANAAAALFGHRRADRRGRLFREGILLVVVMAGLAFAVCALAQAPPDLSRALYTFHALCDLILITDVAWIVQTLAARRKGAIPEQMRVF